MGRRQRPPTRQDSLQSTVRKRAFVSNCSRPRRWDWRFPAQDLGGRRQFYLLWWHALWRIFAEEHSNIFLYEPGGVIGSQDHACVEAQRRIGERLYDHAESKKEAASQGAWIARPAELCR